MVKRLHLEAGGLIQFQLHHTPAGDRLLLSLSGLLLPLCRVGDNSHVVVAGTLNPSTGEDTGRQISKLEATLVYRANFQDS